MASNAHVIRDVTAIHIRPVCVPVISVRTLVAVSTQPVEFTRISLNVIAHRIIHQAIQCTNVCRIFYRFNYIYIERK